MPHPGHFTLHKETQYPLYDRLGRLQVWSGWVQKISLPTGIQSLHCPVRSELLHRLQYPSWQHGI